jgi:hypothetical protein
MLYGFDLERLFYPFGDFMWAAIRQGQLPLWNPTVFLGFPQYAEPQLSLFYPLTWPLAWLSPELAFPLQYALHYGWAAVGGYVLVRRLGGKWAGSVLAGFTIAYALTMTVRLWVGHLPHVMTLAWVPWCLAAAHWAVVKKSWPATLVAAIPLAMAFLIGYIPYLILLVPAMIIFMGWLAGRAWFDGDKKGSLRILGQLAILGIFAALLAAVQLLPTLEFTSFSNRIADRYNFDDSFPIQFPYLLTVLMPDLFGAPRGGIELWLGDLPGAVYWEWALYVGILPLLLFSMAWSWGRKAWRFWVIVGLIGLIVALGDKGVAHRLLFDYVPGMSWFRFASRPVYFFGLSAAIIAGLMFDYWYDRTPEEHARHARLLRTMLLIILPLGFFVIMLSVFWQAAQVETEQLAITSNITSQLIRLLILLIASLALLIWGYGRPRWQLLLLAAAILLVDLWGLGNKYITDVSIEGELGWIMADLALPENRQEYRVMTKALPENGGYFFDFYSIFGYDGFTLEASEKMHELSVEDARVVRLLSGQYLMHGPWWEQPIIAPGWEVLTEPAGVTIYSRDDVGPRTFIVHDLRGAVDEADALRLMADPALDFTQTAVVQAVERIQCNIDKPIEAGPVSVANIVSYEPQQVVIQADAAADGWLILNDLYYPGWQATIDGNYVPIQATDYALRGVCVPAGTHEVVFTFQPSILRYGAIVTGAALLLLVGVIILLLLPRKHKPNEVGPPSEGGPNNVGWPTSGEEDIKPIS